MAITTRAGKGSALTHSEMDSNLIQLEAISSGPAYGLDWDESADTYSRTGAVSHTAIQSKMRRCLVNTAGTVTAYLKASNSNFKEDGSSALLDGTDGNVMVEIPKFYIRHSYAGTTHSWSISSIPWTGYTVHPAFIKNGVEVEHRYIGAFEAYNNSNVLQSRSDVCPTTSLTRGSFRTKAEAIGSGWSLESWNTTSAVQLLMLIEFGTFNSQTAIGIGRTGLSGGSWDCTSYIGITGKSTVNGNSTGANNSTTLGGDAYMSYRGIENFFGNIWKWIDGINVQDNVPYVNNNVDTFADDVFSGDYISAGVTMANANGWQNTLAQVGTAFYPISIGAGSSTKITDYYYQSTGNRVVWLGGSAGDGSRAGAFDLYAAASSGGSSVDIGSRVEF